MFYTFTVNAYGDVIVGRHTPNDAKSCVSDSYDALLTLVRLTHNVVFLRGNVALLEPKAHGAKSLAATIRVRDWVESMRTPPSVA